MGKAHRIVGSEITRCDSMMVEQVIIHKSELRTYHTKSEL